MSAWGFDLPYADGISDELETMESALVQREGQHLRLENGSGLVTTLVSRPQLLRRLTRGYHDYGNTTMNHSAHVPFSLKSVRPERLGNWRLYPTTVPEKPVILVWEYLSMREGVFLTVTSDLLYSEGSGQAEIEKDSSWVENPDSVGIQATVTSSLLLSSIMVLRNTEVSGIGKTLLNKYCPLQSHPFSLSFKVLLDRRCVNADRNLTSGGRSSYFGGSYVFAGSLGYQQAKGVNLHERRRLAFFAYEVN